jgi:hypothetical protein
VSGVPAGLSTSIDERARVAFTHLTALFVGYERQAIRSGAALTDPSELRFCARDERGMSACSTMARPT